MKSKHFIYLVLVIICVVSCTSQKQATLDGRWRAVWTTSGGEVPVDMYIKTEESGELKAEVHNVSEVVEFDRVQRKENHIDFFYDRFECQISAEIAEDGNSMKGTWSKQTGSPAQTPFHAEKGDLERFPLDKYGPPEGKAAMDDISGIWRVQFEGDTYISVGVFEQDGDKVTGTIRAIDGDFRWLEGVYRNGLLLLSHFNGSWAFIFRAEMDEEGNLDGYWARGPKNPVPWTGTKEDVDMPDPFSLTKLTNQEGRFQIKYPLGEDPQRFVSNSDPEFQGKPLLVALTMTGCPNSHDSADLLSQMYKEYHEKGLNILAVNFELIKDVEKIQTRLKRFKEQHELPIPVLFSFAMSKAEIAEEIPELEKFLAWPTVVFIGPDGMVDCIHTGIEGPATGKYHTQLVDEYRKRIGNLISKIE